MDLRVFIVLTLGRKGKQNGFLTGKSRNMTANILVK
jgi:hypothetical protein